MPSLAPAASAHQDATSAATGAHLSSRRATSADARADRASGLPRERRYCLVQVIGQGTQASRTGRRPGIGRVRPSLPGRPGRTGVNAWKGWLGQQHRRQGCIRAAARRLASAAACSADSAACASWRSLATASSVACRHCMVRAPCRPHTGQSPSPCASWCCSAAVSRPASARAWPAGEPATASSPAAASLSAFADLPDVGLGWDA